MLLALPRARTRAFNQDLKKEKIKMANEPDPEQNFVPVALGRAGHATGNVELIPVLLARLLTESGDSKS